MDGPKPDSERLTSVDHTRFSAGENVTVSELGEGVAFTNTFGELIRNPNSNILTDDQKSVSVALEFEARLSFKLKFENFGAQSRSLLFAGITSVQWTELAPEPTPTPSPTENSYAVGDPHVRNILGEDFDVWKTGWNTFVKIPEISGEDD